MTYYFWLGAAAEADHVIDECLASTRRANAALAASDAMDDEGCPNAGELPW